MTGIRSQDSWVLDTAYSGWLDLVLDRADLIVGLDYPRWRSLGRLVRRTAARIIGRRPVCNGNVETLRNALSRDAIIAWHLRRSARGGRACGNGASPPADHRRSCSRHRDRPADSS